MIISFFSDFFAVIVITSPAQEWPSQAEVEVAAVLLAAEGVLTELEQFSFSSLCSELPAVAEEILTGEKSRGCCHFTGKVTASNNEAANALLEIALSSEFCEYRRFFLYFVRSLLCLAGW